MSNPNQPNEPINTSTPWGGNPPTHTPPPAKRKGKAWKIVLGVVVAVTLIAIGSAISSGGNTPSAAPTPPANPAQTPVAKPAAPVAPTTPKPSPAPKPKPAPKVEAPTSFPGDGVYIVGTDVKPGRYKASVADSVIPLCSWQRLSATDGDLESIIASDLKDAGTLIVTIKASDEAFETSGCTDWVLVD